MTQGNLTLAHSLHKTVLMMNKLEEKVLQENFDLPLTQFRILMSIDQHTICQSEIARLWEVSDAAISKQIELLIESGRIARKENPDNRRQYSLVLTHRGQTLLNSAQKIIEKKYAAAYQSLSSTEKSALVDGVKKIELSILNINNPN